jgi:hypothetical protein
MNEKPKKPDALPECNDPRPGPHGHTEHGVPEGATEEEPKGTPDSGRHQTETQPTKR